MVLVRLRHLLVPRNEAVQQSTRPSESWNYALTAAGLCSTVVSAFAIIILSVLAVLYRSGHEEFAGTLDDPEPEKLGAIAGTIFTAVIVYAVSFLLSAQLSLAYLWSYQEVRKDTDSAHRDS